MYRWCILISWPDVSLWQISDVPCNRIWPTIQFYECKSSWWIPWMVRRTLVCDDLSLMYLLMHPEVGLMYTWNIYDVPWGWPDVSLMYLWCTLRLAWCILDVSLMYPEAGLVYPWCILDVSLMLSWVYDLMHPLMYPGAGLVYLWCIFDVS